MVPPFPVEGSTIYVFDTSSLIELRQRVPIGDRKHAFVQLTAAVKQGQLVFPSQTFDELERASDQKRKDDPVLAWAKANKATATRFGPCLEEIKRVLANPVSQRILDPDKSGVDEADPHVLALGLHLEGRYQVVIATEETRDRPRKLSMATACGALRLVRVSIENILAEFSLVQ